jgi:hypothetical protein
MKLQLEAYQAAGSEVVPELFGDAYDWNELCLIDDAMCGLDEEQYGMESSTRTPRVYGHTSAGGPRRCCLSSGLGPFRHRHGHARRFHNASKTLWRTEASCLVYEPGGKQTGASGSCCYVFMVVQWLMFNNACLNDKFVKDFETDMVQMRGELGAPAD